MFAGDKFFLWVLFSSGHALFLYRLNHILFARNLRRASMNCVLSSGERLELPNYNYTFRSSRLCPLVSFRGTKFAAIFATLARAFAPSMCNPPRPWFWWSSSCSGLASKRYLFLLTSRETHGRNTTLFDDSNRLGRYPCLRPRSSESRIRLPIFVPSALLNDIYRISNANGIDVSYDRILWIEEFL